MTHPFDLYVQDSPNYFLARRVECGLIAPNLPDVWKDYRLIGKRIGGSGNGYHALYAKPKLHRYDLLNLLELLDSALFVDSDNGESITLSTDNALIIISYRAPLWVGKGGWRMRNLKDVFSNKVLLLTPDEIHANFDGMFNNLVSGLTLEVVT